VNEAMIFCKPTRRVLVWGVWANVVLTGILLILDLFLHLWGHK